MNVITRVSVVSVSDTRHAFDLKCRYYIAWCNYKWPSRINFELHSYILVLGILIENIEEVVPHCILFIDHIVLARPPIKEIS